MSYITIIYSILAVLGTLVVAVFVGTLLPGFERKYIQARLQQRIGPNFASPGLFSTIKFFFNKVINFIKKKYSKYLTRHITDWKTIPFSIKRNTLKFINKFFLFTSTNI